MKILCNATGCIVTVGEEQAAMLLKNGFSKPKEKQKTKTTAKKQPEGETKTPEEPEGDPETPEDPDGESEETKGTKRTTRK